MFQITNFISKLDVIGPEIKFYNMKKDGTRDQTFFGGILSILAIALSIAVSFFFFMDIIDRTNPKAFEVKKYQDDTPKIYFDKSGMYFGIMFRNPRNDIINSSFLEFYGVIKSVKEEKVIANYKFEKCTYEKDFNGMDDLFLDYKEEIDSSWFCVSSMIQDGIIIPKNDTRYIVPYTQHGMASKSTDPLYFEVGGNRCINSTENKNFCLPNETIDKFLVSSDYRINLINKMFDTNNYQNPISSVLEVFTGSASPSTFASNYINLNNIQFKTHNGLMFDNIEVIDTFQFNDRVEIVSSIIPGTSNDGRIFMFRLEGQNIPVTYERYYSRIQEVLANIGGVIKCIFILVKFINYFHVSFIEKKKILQNVLLKHLKFDARKSQKQRAQFNLSKEFIIKSNESPSSHISAIKSEISLYPTISPTNLLSPIKMDKKFLKTFSNEIQIFSQKSRKKNSIRKKSINKNAITDTLKLGFFSYFALKIKNMIKWKKDKEVLDHLELCTQIKNKILNESSFYKLYFDIAKFKRVIFDDEQLEAFEKFRMDFKSVFQESKNKYDLNSLFLKFSVSTNPIDQNLAKFIGETLKHSA